MQRLRRWRPLRPESGHRSPSTGLRTRPLTFERLEERLLLSVFDVPVASRDILSATRTDWYENSGALSGANPLDVYRFTLTQAAGVFIDIDARDVGLSSLDSIVRLFSGATLVAENDDGYDFEGIDPARGLSRDASLYADLSPGSYEVQVTGFGGSSGAYLMRMLFDTTYSAAVPAFHSLLGAADTLSLDFDGHAASDAWGTYNALPFNFGGGPAGTFSPGERLAIRNIWRTVAEDFSPFQLNVTTVSPGTFADRVSFRMVITESNGSIVDASGALGVAYLDSYNSGGSSDQVAWVFASAFDSFGAGSNLGWSGRIVAGGLEMGNTVSHEFGHALGLQHWAARSGDANGADVLPNGIMATPDTGLGREIWQVGNRNEVGLPQDDIAVIASSKNTFGFRPDDHGDTRATATVLSASGLQYAARGIISHPSNDLDYFRFEAADATTILVDVDESVNNLDLEVRLFAGDGTLLALSDPANSFDGSLSRTLSQGVYFLEVKSDGEPGEVGQYTVQITTGPLFNAPPIARDDDITGHEDGPVTGNLITANNGHGVDSDPEGTTLTLVAVNGAAVANGQVVTLPSGARLTLFTNGDFVYDPNGRFESLRLGGSTTDTFAYTIADAAGQTAAATVTVTVHGRNDAPIARPNSRTTSEDAPVSGNVLTDDSGAGVDSDVDAGTVLSVVRINGAPVTNGQLLTLPSGARLTIFSHGQYTYDPAGRFDDLGVGRSRNDSFTYSISDGDGGLAAATVTITITGVNDPPAAVPNAYTTDEDAAVSGNLLTDDTGLGVDGDVDGDPLALVRINGNVVTSGQSLLLPSGARLVIHTDGRFTYDPNGVFSPLHDGQTAQDSFTYTIADPMGAVSTATAAITVDGVTQRVFVNGTEVRVVGSEQDDVFAFNAQLLTVTVNGRATALPAETTYVRLDGGGGADQLFLTATTGNDLVVLRPTVALLDFLGGQPGFDFVAVSVETISVDGNGGTFDQAFLDDSPGDDLFTGRPREASLTGVGFANRVTNFHTIAGRVTGGGTLDQASLFDSSGEDVAALSPQIANLSGPGFFLQVAGFSRVAAEANAGGLDRAFLRDSPGDDTFEFQLETARFSGPQFLSTAVGFEVVSAAAVAGGHDLAILQDSPGDDRFVSRPHVSFLHGPAFVEAASFETVSARAVRGGFDQAFLIDSPGDETFTASSLSATMTDGAQTREAIGFDVVAGWALSGGNDTALLFDTEGNDTVSLSRGRTNFSGPAGLYLQALGFATVSARCVNGGFDRAFLFDTAGNDVFSATPQVASLSGTGYAHQVVGFDSVQARSNAGVDRASFSDSAGADLFVVDRQTATLSGAGFVHQAVGFSIVAAQASSSADVARLTDTPGNDAFVGRGADGALTSAGWSVSLTRFGTVHLAGTQGGVNRLDVLNLTYVLQLTGIWTPV
jgi:VCBS repeat-containing protein